MAHNAVSIDFSPLRGAQPPVLPSPHLRGDVQIAPSQKLKATNDWDTDTINVKMYTTIWHFTPASPPDHKRHPLENSWILLCGLNYKHQTLATGAGSQDSRRRS